MGVDWGMKHDFLLTRILSVFNLLKRVGFAVLFLTGTAFAQPQAPIEWGEIRLLQNPTVIDNMTEVRAQGDTILLAARHAVDGSSVAMVTVSGNNGLTWSPWHIFDSDDLSGSYATVVFTSNAILAAVNVSNSFYGIYRSEDLGENWEAPDTALLDLRMYQVKNDTVFCSRQPNALLWTADEGVTFSPARPIDFGNYHINDLSVSDTLQHAMSIMRYQGQQLNARYTRGGLLEGEFEPHRAINDVYCTYGADLEFAGDGVGVLASVVLFEPPVPDYGRLFINVTRDDGATWSEADTMNLFDTVGALRIIVRNNGRHWAVVHTDTTVSPGFLNDGMYISFSANHARSWYPRQQATGDDVFGGELADVDLQPDRIRIYAYYARWNDIPGKYSFQWEGQIQRDTMAPALSDVIQQPILVPLDTSLTFAATASDDDSLWTMQVVLQRVGEEDSLVIDLAAQGEDTYSNTWRTPADTSQWTYYYLAEDMWENVTRIPDSGSFHFVTDGWSNANENPLFPHSFSVLAYPNPFNSTLSISLDVPLYRDVTLSLYDLLGREVDVVYRGSLSANTISYAAPAELSSGVYFLRAVAGDVSVLRKVVLLK